MYKEFHSKGLNIIGVSLDNDAVEWKDAIAKDGLNWYQISNLKGWEDPIALQYKVSVIPTTFVIDVSGEILAKDLKGIELRNKIEELLTK